MPDGHEILLGLPTSGRSGCGAGGSPCFVVAFHADASLEHPFDWVLVQNSSVSLCTDLRWLDATLTRLDELGYQTLMFDSSAWSGEEEMHRDFHRTLRLPH